LVASLTIPRLIGHRGGGTLAPENTLAGLRTAVRFGYRAVEFDVMLSADGTPVLIHDETLERTTNGRGAVVETPDAVLLQLDAGSWHGTAFASERIPTLAAAAAVLHELRLWANVEIKPAAGYEARTGEIVARVVRNLWLGRPPALLSSFSVAALGAAREMAPQLPRGLLVEAIPADWREQVRELQCMSLHCSAAMTTPAEIRQVADSGTAVVCYTVNDVELGARLMEAGAAIITDRLDLFQPS
jgi:glycerophosphoryl diester phosphodiesterase